MVTAHTELGRTNRRMPRPGAFPIALRDLLYQGGMHGGWLAAGAGPAGSPNSSAAVPTRLSRRHRHQRWRRHHVRVDGYGRCVFHLSDNDRCRRLNDAVRVCVGEVRVSDSVRSDPIDLSGRHWDRANVLGIVRSARVPGVDDAAHIDGYRAGPHRDDGSRRRSDVADSRTPSFYAG